MNQIITYADIDWSKSQHEILFTIANTHEVNFTLNTALLNFSIDTNNIVFDINTHNETFNIETHNIRFTASICV